MDNLDKPSTSLNITQVDEDAVLQESSSSLVSGEDDNVMDTNSPDKIPPALDGWTKEDKFQLYLGLKHVSSKNIANLREYLPKKTLPQIKAAVHHYKKIANRTPECTNKKLFIRKKKSKTVIPLARWAKLLTDTLDYEELHTELVSAVHLIADFDNIAHPSLTEQIDVRQAYHQIAGAMEGKPLTHIKYISELLKNCIFETALLSKTFMAPSLLKHVLRSVNFSELAPAFPKITDNYQESIIRRLAAEKNYNPLGIPLQHLLPALPKKHG